MGTCGKDLMTKSRDNLETLIPDYGAALHHQLQMKLLSNTIDSTLLCWERDLQKKFYPQAQDQPLDLKIKNCSSSHTNKQTSGKIRSHLVKGVYEVLQTKYVLFQAMRDAMRSIKLYSHKSQSYLDTLLFIMQNVQKVFSRTFFSRLKFFDTNTVCLSLYIL